jgi:hypothetical protein
VSVRPSYIPSQFISPPILLNWFPLILVFPISKCWPNLVCVLVRLTSLLYNTLKHRYINFPQNKILIVQTQ